MKNRRTTSVMFDLTGLQRIGLANPSGAGPMVGSSGIWLVAEIDGFTNGCAKGLSGGVIHGPADASESNPPNIGDASGAPGSSGAGARAGPANEFAASSQSNEGGVMSSVSKLSLGGFKAELPWSCAKTGWRKTSAEAAANIATIDAHRVKLRKRPSFFNNVVFISLSSFHRRFSESAIAFSGWNLR